MCQIGKKLGLIIPIEKSAGIKENFEVAVAAFSTAYHKIKDRFPR